MPGEFVQIIDGDIYIDGRIVRKPFNVQRELWMPIYLQEYQPPRNREDTLSRWRQPFANEPDSLWKFNAEQPDRFVLNEPDDSTHTLVFDSGYPDDFRVIYGYNDSGSFSMMPMCSDLMIRFQAKTRDAKSSVGAVLEKYGVLYAARVDLLGAMIFLKYQGGQWMELRRTLTDGIYPGTFETFEFASVDRRLVLRWGQKRFAYDLVNDKDLADIDEQTSPPQVKLFGSGGLDIRNVGLYRDIHYIDAGIRATHTESFRLKDDEFFVCGDNSPNSLDSRLWELEGFGNHNVRYRKGIVPRDYMMGKAVLVYWSQAFRPRPTIAPIIPNFNTVRFIFGSSEQEY